MHVENSGGTKKVSTTEHPSTASVEDQLCQQKLAILYAEWFGVIFEEVKTAETNVKENYHLIFFLGARGINHMKQDSVAFILISKHIELKRQAIICALSSTSRSGKRNLKKMVRSFILYWIDTYICHLKRKNLSYKRYVHKACPYLLLPAWPQKL